MILLEYKKFTLAHLFKDIFFVSLCSLVIAVVFMLLTASEFTLKTYLDYLLIAQCIGLSIGIPCTLAFHLLKPQKPLYQMLLVTVCVLAGAILGSYIAGHFSRNDFFILKGKIPVEMIFVAAILGFLISFGFVMYERYVSFRLSAGDEKLKRLSLEKNMINTPLKLLKMRPLIIFSSRFRKNGC